MPPFGIRVAPAWKADDKRTALGVDAHVHGLDDSTVADGDARRGVIDRSPGNARTGLLASRTLLRRHSASEWGPRVIWIAPQPGNRSLAHQPESSPHTGVGSRQVHEISRCAHFPDEARGCREDLFGSHLNVVRRLFRAHAETARHDNLSNSEERRARLNREAEIAPGPARADQQASPGRTAPGRWAARPQAGSIRPGPHVGRTGARRPGTLPSTGQVRPRLSILFASSPRDNR